MISDRHQAGARTLTPDVLADERGVPESRAARPGYTLGMKTAVSLPDDVFADADRLARRLKTSRSRVYSDAVREYVARHDPDEVTATLDAVVGKIDAKRDPFVAYVARRALERVEW